MNCRHWDFTSGGGGGLGDFLIVSMQTFGLHERGTDEQTTRLVHFPVKLFV